MSNKAAKVLESYSLCNSLKNVVRTGWKIWHVNKERVESIAEHIYGVQMLAISMHSTYGYDLDLNHIIMMLSIHEMEEILMGDLTFLDTDKDVKNIIGEKAVEAVLKNYVNKNELRAIIKEFDDQKTPEAKFAFQCDKLEADIQAKLYGEAGAVDMYKQDQETMNNPLFAKYVATGKPWETSWLQFSRNRYDYDENFVEVSEYAENNHISINPTSYAKEQGIVELLEYSRTHTKEEFLKYVEEN